MPDKQQESDQVATRLSSKEIEEIGKLVETGFYMNTADFIRQAVREKLESIEIIEPRNIPKNKAKEEILNYMKNKGRAYPSDIADALRLDVDLVISVTKDLLKEGRVR